MPPIKRSRQKSYDCSQEKSKLNNNNNRRNHYEQQEMPKPHVHWKDEYKFSQNLFGGESSQGIYGGPSFQPMSPANRLNHDKYCWKCHLSDTDCFCFKCTRSYHRACATRKQDGNLPNDWKCGQCVQLAAAKSTSIECSKQELNELLGIVVARLNSDPRAFNINDKDWRVLQQKVKNQHYDSTLELIVDMKEIDHKHAIEFGGSVNSTRDVMKQILEKCKSEITDLKLCGECYRNSNEDHAYFTTVCTARHKLIWAELKGYPYWPAKIMEFKDATTYKVQFFGKHDYAYVPISNTKIFTPRNPNAQLDEKARAEIDACMPEALAYFEALKQAGNNTNSFPKRQRVTSLLSSDNDEFDDAEDEDSSGSLFGDTDSNKSNSRHSNREIAHIKKQINGILKDNHTIKNEMAEINKRMADCLQRAKCDGKLKTRCINCGSKATLLFLATPFCKQACVNHMWKTAQEKL